MYGVLTIRPPRFTAKCGFKYINLDPQLVVLQGRQIVQYKNKVIPYDESDKIVLEIDEKDITNESMTKITVSDCKILDKTLKSGTVSSTGYEGCRQVVVNRDMKKYPILQRRSNGNIPDRHDLMCYDDSDYIIFRVEWNGSDFIRTIISSDAHDKDDCHYWQELHEKEPGLSEFLKKSSRPPQLPFGQINQNAANIVHKDRFLRKYGKLLRYSHKIKMSNCGAMDVIDLTTIDEIKITDPAALDSYPIFEITTKGLRKHGNGLDSKVFENVADDKKNLFMLITDAVSHSIDVRNRRMLFIHTLPIEFKIGRELLFVKFNKGILHRYKRDLLVDRLSI